MERPLRINNRKNYEAPEVDPPGLYHDNAGCTVRSSNKISLPSSQTSPIVVST